MRSRAAVWLPLLVLTAGFVALLSVALYRNAYGNLPWQGLPERLGWCGRDYNSDHSPSRWTPRMSQGGVHPAFRAPPIVGRQVFSDFSPEEIERKRDANEVCGLLLYVKSGDEYMTYALSGGP
jgi:hypothetical protein